MAHLLVRPSSGAPRRVPLDGGEVRIGRAPDCELVIEDEGASRVHAIVRGEGGGFVVEDAGSRNGTFVNERPVRRQQLRDGDCIRVGRDTRIEFASDPEEAPPRPSRGRPRARVASRGARGRGPVRGFWREVRYVLEPADQSAAEPHVLASRVTTVGREAPARIILRHDSISRLHARVDRDSGRLFVTDLKSRNGTTVNGAPAQRAELHPGDVVRFGEVEFEVVREEALAWKRLALAGGALAVAVAVALGFWGLGDALQERAAVREAEARLRRQAVASVRKGIDAYRAGQVDYARGYFSYAADLLMLSQLAPPGASLSRPEQLFGGILAQLPAPDRGFDFSRALDLAAEAGARARLEGLADPDFIGHQIRRISIELGQDPEVPQGFVEQVSQSVERFRRERATFQRMLDRSPRVQPRLASMLDRAHLPEAFCYVAWIESGLDSRATSPVGARGLWQFMPATARGYGLRVEPGSGVDERTDVVRSTEAATRYMGNLIRKFGREQFMCALASYNRGENAVWRAMERIPDPMMESSRKYWYLVENRLLPKETSEYVPRIFAVQILAADPARFGFRLP